MSRLDLDHVWMVVIGILLLVVIRINLPLLEPEEARYAEIPRQMLVANQFVVPVLDGSPYLDKPPLTYWFQMPAYVAFGANTWSARLAPCLASLLIAAAVWHWGRHIGGPTAGWLAAGILLTMPDFAYRAPMITPNVLLALFVVAGLSAGQLALQRDGLQLFWWSLSALAAAAAIMTKGPIAMVLVSLPLFTLVILQRQTLRQTSTLIAAHLALSLLLTAPWFLVVNSREPGFAEYFFWKHHVERALTPFDHAQPFWYYLPRFLVGSLPWILMPLIWLLVPRFARSEQLPNTNWCFPLATAIWCVLFLSMSGSKRPVYLLPAYPPLAVGIASLLVSSKLGEFVRLRCINGLATGLLVVFAVWLPGYHREHSLAALAESIPAELSTTPIVCCPHSWNMITFMRPNSDVTTFREDQRAAMISQFRLNGTTLLLIAKNSRGEDALGTLPTNLKATLIAEDLNARLMRVSLIDD